MTMHKSGVFQRKKEMSEKMCEMQCIHYSFIHTVSLSIFIITPAIFNYDE